MKVKKVRKAVVLFDMENILFHSEQIQPGQVQQIPSLIENVKKKIHRSGYEIIDTLIFIANQSKEIDSIWSPERLRRLTENQSWSIRQSDTIADDPMNSHLDALIKNHGTQIDLVVICSADEDFATNAQQLRDKGYTVWVMHEKPKSKTSNNLLSKANRFIQIKT